MATYKETKGTNVENFSSDPANPVDGQVWYNTTSNVLKVNNPEVGSWATANNMNTAAYARGGAGTQTAALAFGGIPPNTGLTETYNGTNWTEVNDLNTARYTLAGAGTNTAALAFGGDNPGNTAATETWNGTNWTEVNDLNTARYSLAGAGTNTAALGFGGYLSPGGSHALTESWNGTNWTEVNNLNTARRYLAGTGTQTAALAFSGIPPFSTGATETWTTSGGVATISTS